MTDHTRLSVRAVLATAFFLAAGAAGSSAARAADDPALVRLHAPCHQALVEEQRASDYLRPQNNTAPDVKKALNAVGSGLAWNEACHKLAGRSQPQNANSDKMYHVNKAFLLSLRAQAQTVQNVGSAARTYADANRELSACVTAGSSLPEYVRQRCEKQLGYNSASQRGGTVDSSCQFAVQAANDAGAALKSLDYAHFERAYQRATEGIAANKKCPPSLQMHDVNSAFLLTWKAVADRYLDVPWSTDGDIADPRNPFAVPNDLLRKCGSWGPPFDQQARIDCNAQGAANLRFQLDYTTPPTPVTGQTIKPLDPQRIEWPYSLRPDFVWDLPCTNNETARCADEEVRDGSGPHGWGFVPPGDQKTAVPLEGDRERALFATIRNCDDLHRLFTGQPPQVTCDFFKSSARGRGDDGRILLVVAQHKPHQKCTMRIDNVASVAAPTSANPPRDAVRLNYTLTCEPPGASGSTAMQVMSIPSGNEHGAFANVTFIQSGPAGPMGGTY